MKRILPLLLIPFTIFAAYDPDNPIVEDSSGCILSHVTVSQTESSSGAGLVFVPPTSIEDSEPVIIAKDKTGMYHLTFHVPTLTSEPCTGSPVVKLTDKAGREWIMEGTTVYFDLVARKVDLPIFVQIYSSGGSLSRIGSLGTKCSACEHACPAGGDLQGDVSDRGLNTNDGAFQGNFGIGGSDHGDTSSRLEFNVPSTQTFSISDLQIHSNGGYSVSGSGPIDYITSSSVTTTTSVTGGVQVKQYAIVGGTPQTSSFRTINFQNLSGGVLKATVIDDVNNKSFVHEWRHPNATTWEYVYGNGMRKKIVTRTALTASTRSERHQEYERNSSETGEVTADSAHKISDVEFTYTLFGVQWQKTKEVIDPSGSALTTLWTYYGSNDVTDPLAGTGAGPYAGTGRVSLVSRYDSSTCYYFYSTNANREEHDFMSTAMGYKIERIYTPATESSLVVETQSGTETKKSIVEFAGNVETQKNYHDTSNFLTTTTSYMSPGADFGGNPVKVTQPDLTIATYTYARTTTEKTTTMQEGAGTSSVTSGTQTITRHSAGGTLLSQITTAISSGSGNGIVLSSLKNHTIDAFGRPTLVYYFPDSSGANPKWTEATAYSCCGVSSSTDRYGVVTTYTYDDLKRQTSSSNLGVSSATEYNGLTTISLRGGQIIGKQINNLSGTVRKSYSPSAQTGALPADATPSSTVTTTYKNPHSGSPNSLPSGIGTKSVTTLIQVGDDGAVIPTETNLYYFDGSKKFTTSNMGPSVYLFKNPLYTYSYLRKPPFNSDGTGGSFVELSYNISDMLGRTYLRYTPSTLQNYSYYNNLGQLYLSRDADSNYTCYNYNSRGQQTITTSKRSAGTSITYGTDTIQYSETAPALRGSIPVLRTISKVWQPGDTNANNGTILSTVDRTPDGLQTWQESIGVAQPATSVTTLVAPGSWTEKSTAPDGTYSLTTFTDGKWDKTEQFYNTNTLLYSSSVNRDSGDTIIGYDAYNRLTQVKDSRTGVTTTTYRSDISDAVIAVQPPAGATQTTSYTYDHRGRRTHVDAPNSFDPAGSPGNTNLTNITVTSYNPSGTVASVTGAQNYPISYTYDYADRIKSMTTSSSSGNVITAWNYSTTTGLLTSKRYNSNLSGTTGTGPSYLYTSAGRLSKRTWARPISTANATLIATNYTYTYGLLSAVTYNDGTPNLAYTYDSLGRMKTVSRAGSSHYIYNYDATTLRLSSEQQNIDSFPRNLLRYYDSLGRPLSLDLTTTANVSDYTTGYAFDAAGRLQNVWHHPALDVTSKAPSGAATFKYGYTYTQATATDLRAGFTSGADLKQDYIPYTITRNASGSDPALTATRTYEANRDALRSIVNKSGTSEISSYTYSVNAIIQRESVTTAGSAFAGTQADWLWQYDPLGQVVRADHANTADSDRVYEYDNIGNRIKTASGTLTLPTSVNWVSNALNQYTTADGVALPTTPAPAPFDLDGNMTAGPVPGTNGNIPAVQAPANATDIKWDAENRLISLTLGTTVYSYSYDHLSRLISCSTGGTVNARYAYDGWNRIAQYDETTLQDTFTWGLDISGSMQGAGGVGGLLATRWVSSSNTDYFPTYDGNGNVSEYLATDGTSSVHYEYDPFGTLTRRTGSSSTRFQYRFSTKPRDIDTGLYYYGYRWYDPLTGRWPSRDPIEESGGVNLYGFVGNDGVGALDLFGLSSPKWPRPKNCLELANQVVTRFIGRLFNDVTNAKSDENFSNRCDDYFYDKHGTKNPKTPGQWRAKHATDAEGHWQSVANMCEAMKKVLALYEECLKSGAIVDDPVLKGTLDDILHKCKNPRGGPQSSQPGTEHNYGFRFKNEEVAPYDTGPIPSNQNPASMPQQPGVQVPQIPQAPPNVIPFPQTPNRPPNVIPLTRPPYTVPEPRISPYDPYTTPVRRPGTRPVAPTPIRVPMPIRGR